MNDSKRKLQQVITFVSQQNITDEYEWKMEAIPQSQRERCIKKNSNYCYQMNFKIAVEQSR